MGLMEIIQKNGYIEAIADELIGDISATLDLLTGSLEPQQGHKL